MSDFGWMLVCGLSLAAMGSAYLIDRQRWRRRAHLLALQAQAATMGLQHARRVRKLQVRHYMDEANAFYSQKQAAEGRVDGLEAAMIEIRRIAAKEIKKIDGLQAFPAEAVHHLAGCNCSCQGNAIQANANYHNSECMVGRAQQFLAAGGDDGDWSRPVTVGDPDVDQITEIIGAYNQSFHQAKGVADAGVIQEEERGDRGRPGCDDHGA